MMLNKVYTKLVALLKARIENADPIVKQLKGTPRYVPGSIVLRGHTFKYADSASFLFTYEEIYKRSIYKFLSTRERPFIIDAGANIGVSVLYFKQLYGNARVVAFEPDKKIFAILQDNVNAFGLQNVTLVNKGLWNEEKELRFYAEGADAGRISTDTTASHVIDVVSLRSYLSEPVDLLKIDIEGAEMIVLKDCESHLQHVKNIFVEYHSFVGQEQSLPELLDILKRAGFRLNINAPGLISKNPFVKVNAYNGMDMQLNIYGIRS
ncbi:FkbM family methyltransferase [Chryseolinea lacunae]|uniref:FkbM family methyltransferase n=1 Tax=Chryseolinea lacunae TaxID=2801331 RepID=A0ABS1KX53_9BACT|nr:FkbM family methyltransferase [Chryseolinea lacunae]MBL0744031.1 FkbM family methyltransferase [Chryseolinea lacunae]